VHQPGAGAGAGFGQHARGLGVDAERGLRLGLGAIDGGVGGGVDHHVWSNPLDQGPQGLRAVEVGHLAAVPVGQPAAAGGADHFAQLRKLAAEGVADLAVRAQQQQPHGA